MPGDNIFEITADVKALEALIESLEAEEVPDEDRLDKLAAFVMHRKQLLRKKIDAYVSVYRSREARAKARRTESQHLAELARYDENDMERIKAAIQLVAKALGQKKLEGEKRSITVSPSDRPAIDIVSVDDIPLEFKEEVTDWKVDRKAIADHVAKTGEIVPGTETRKIVRVIFR